MVITIVFSNHCKMDCAYCCIREKNTSPVLSIGEAVSLIEEHYEKNPVVEFFGGEPTLHWDMVTKIMDKYPDLRYSIYTNGQWIFHDDKTADKYWKQFDQIYISLDGTYEMNAARKNTAVDYEIIKNNIKHLNRINLKTAVATVYGTKKSFKNMKNTVKYLESLGTRSFSFELATVWEDDNCIGLDEYNLMSYVSTCVYLLNKSFQGNLRFFDMKREMISSDFYFNAMQGASCSDKVRAISPRGNIYHCRDHAANEEGLIKRNKRYAQEPIPILVIGEELSNEPTEINPESLIMGHDGTFDHLKYLDKLTPCPVKSHQFMMAGDEGKLWWLEGEWQTDVIQMLYRLIKLNTRFVEAAVAGKTINREMVEMKRELLLDWFSTICKNFNFPEELRDIT